MDYMHLSGTESSLLILSETKLTQYHQETLVLYNERKCAENSKSIKHCCNTFYYYCIRVKARWELFWGEVRNSSNLLYNTY